MAFVTIKTKGYKGLMKWFRRAVGDTPTKANAVTQRMAVDLVAEVQKNASGPPGPNVVTGAYRSSIRIMEEEFEGNNTTIYVGTDAPQALRLEYGFVGVDALGRHYAQSPRPHWQPAVETIAKKFEEEMKHIGVEGDFSD